MDQSHLCYVIGMPSDDVMKKLRSSGLPQAEIAKRTGIARETLSRWENGVQRPSLEDLERVARAVGADLQVRVEFPSAEMTGRVNAQLDLGPTNRLKTLAREEWPGMRDALRAAAHAGRLVALVGPVAAALQGSPELARDSRVNLIVAESDLDQTRAWLRRAAARPDTIESDADGARDREKWLAGSGELTLAVHPAAREVVDRSIPSLLNQEPVGTVYVALVEDLLDIADERHWPEDQDSVRGLTAVLATGRYSSRDRRLSGPPDFN